MKTLSLILVTGLALAGCQNDSHVLVNSPSAANESSLQKTANLEATLQDVAQMLAQQSHWLNASLANEMKLNPVSIAKLQVNAPARLENDGRVYDVTLEAFGNSDLASAEAVRIALDPDRFYADESAFAVYVLDRGQNRVVNERVDKAALQRGVSFPLVLVTLQDRTEMSFAEMRRGSKIFQEHEAALAKNGSAAAANGLAPFYLALTKVRLHVDHDDFSFEEFEMYVREGNGATDYFLPTTIHKFDGTRRKDAAGRTVYYPDVNVINTTYAFESPIALWPLSDALPISIAPLEDDCIAGEHRNWIYPYPYVKIMLQEYSRAADAIRLDTRLGYQLTGVGCSFGNDDDTYARGTFSNWTASNTPEQEISIDLGDLQIWVKKLVMLPPVPKEPPSEE
jgi:hypothetical protein